MLSLKRIQALIYKDLRESFNNKVILVAILLPFFASLLFGFMNNTGTPKNFNLAVAGNNGKEQELVRFIENNYLNLSVEYYRNFKQVMITVENGQNDALVTQEGPDEFKLYINNQSPVTYLILKDKMDDILMNFRGKEPPLKIESVPVNTPKTRYSILPTWILITVTMIGVMIISGNIAEERENNTLAAIRVSPVKEAEILLGKGGFGVIISTLTVVLMLIFNRVYRQPYVFLAAVLFVFLASFCFSAIGLFIGSLASSQSSARSIGTIIYFPLIFPALIYDFSGLTRTLARFFPTYYMLRGLQKLLFNEVTGSKLLIEVIYLISFAVVFSLLTLFIFRKVSKSE